MSKLGKALGRTLFMGAFLLSGLMPGFAHALGLGGIDLYTSLNQPLRAEIELRSVDPIHEGQIFVALADQSAFDRSGIERPFLLAGLKFQVLTESNGKSFIEVTSREPIREPFLSFIIEVSWPKGRQLREYTILLDLPVVQSVAAPVLRTPVVSKKPAPVAVQSQPKPVITAPQSVPVKQAPVARRSVPTPAAPAPKVQAPEPQSVTEAEQTRRVGTGDTLWAIGDETRPDRSVSIEQMMLALQRANPNAFLGGNVNKLTEGFVLRIPDKPEIESLGKKAARSEFLRQTAEWRAQRESIAVAASFQKDVPFVKDNPVQDEPESIRDDSEPLKETFVVDTSEAEVDQPQLKLLAPTDSVNTVSASTISGEAADDLDTGIERVQADLAMATEEAATAREEAGQLRKDVESMQSQINELRSLFAVKDQQLAELQARLVSESSADAKAVESVVVAEQEKSDGFLAGQNNLMYLGAALFGAVVLFLFVRRRREDDETPVADVLARQSFATPHSDAELPVDIDEIQSDSEQVDPLAEADVYIAYGRYQEAEDILNIALRKEPGNSEINVKLLELYYATANGDAYEDLARTVSDHVADDDPDAWDKVVTMGREVCPDSDLFNQAYEPEIIEPMSADETSAKLVGISGIDLDMPIGQPESTGVAGDSLENILEFDLGSLSVEDGAGVLDEVATKLDLARAYLDVGDAAAAKDILNEIIEEGDSTQVDEANALLSSMES